MNIIQSFFAKRKFAKAQADAERIGSAIAPFLNVTGQVALPELKRGISTWNLSNEVLRKYLGYVAGVIDAGQQNTLGKTSTDDWTATELVFHQVIGAQLDWIPGCELFLEMNRQGLEVGGTAIGGMQRLPDFNEAMQLGASDFLSVGSPGFFPKGLHELGLFLSIQDGAENSSRNEPSPDEYLCTGDHMMAGTNELFRANPVKRPAKTIHLESSDRISDEEEISSDPTATYRSFDEFLDANRHRYSFGEAEAVWDIFRFPDSEFDEIKVVQVGYCPRCGEMTNGDTCRKCGL